MGGEDEKGSIHGEREPKHFDGLKIVDETNGSGKSETYSMHGRDLLNIEQFMSQHAERVEPQDTYTSERINGMERSSFSIVLQR